LLPAEARAALIDSLLESLDDRIDEDAEECWRHEIHRRLEEMDDGALKLLPWDNTRRRLWARLKP
jgi:putative addiction module component (TIGR02574 family)